jgi:DNA-binding helix-turn-helix protein|nr:MAG TPA: helix-turn-helix domain protein [Caudoviricetes sp.]
MENKVTFAEQFKLWRLAKGFNKSEAAFHFGVSPEAVCHWEKGVAQPPDGKILTMCEEMKLNPQLFLRKKTNPFAEMLKKKRNEFGLTQEKLGREIGYTRDTIARWELAKLPSGYALEIIRSYFGMEVEVWEKLSRENSRS